jgi:hypothetical protein
MSEAYGVDASGNFFGIVRDAAGKWRSEEWAAPAPLSEWAADAVAHVSQSANSSNGF